MTAGHETTAHTLAFAIGLLALYADKQEELYQQVKDIVADSSGRLESQISPPFLLFELLFRHTATWAD